MPKHLIIAEKPSLAKTIAEVRGKMLGVRPSRGQNYWTVGDDVVLWLFGHLLELVEPHHYDPRWKSWNPDDLPFYPKNWQHEPKKVYENRKLNEQKTRDCLAQINATKALLRDSQIVVNAGDPEREGQLLVDELLIFLGWDPFNSRTKRFWSQSLTEGEVTKNFNNMLDNATKRNLYIAAFARQKADWLHGLNMTRLYTSLARRTGAQMTLSVGRVQTPLLKLVVDRDREIANFKPTDHFLPTGWFAHPNGRFKAKWEIPADHQGVDHEGRLVDRTVAQSILDRIAGKQGTISNYETKNNSKGPPLPYRLSTLQQDCSSKFGLTAQQTLDVAQSLYEKHKATSYPRTDSQYLPVSVLKEQASSIMAAMTATPGVDRAAQTADLKIKSKAWDDSKVSDHYAIIPTTEFHAGKLNDMSPIERNVFMLIAKSFVAQFHPDQTWKSISAVVKCEGLSFRATGKLPGSPGWRVVYDGEVEEDEEDEKSENQTVPAMKKGDSVTAEKGELVASRTKPPAAFTDGTLIAAMTNIHLFVSDPEIKKRLKENSGIGTEATRANHIENLVVVRKFLQRTGSGKVKKITSTDVGKSVIDALPLEMSSPGMTAIWEAQLEKIEKGEFPEEQFMKVLHDTLIKRVNNAKNLTVTIKGQSIEPMPGDGEVCSVCKKGTMRTRPITSGDLKGKRVLACDNWRKDDPTSCRHAVWPDRPKAEPVPPAPGHGKECPRCKIGKLETKKSPTKGTIYLSCSNWHGKDDPKSCNHYEFPEEKVDKMPGDGEPCKKCGKGHMRTIVSRSKLNAGKTFLSCSAYPECNNSVFPDNFKSSNGNSGGSKGDSRNSSKSGSKSGGKSASKSNTPFKPGSRPNPFGTK